jgi:mannitol-specific phosphotransferase system IIBC component
MEGSLMSINPEGSNEKNEFISKLNKRYYKALNYLSIYVYVIIVYGTGLIADYILFALIDMLIIEDTKKYPIVAVWFEHAKIGLALLFISCAVIHGVFSTIGQIKTDYTLSRES